MTLTQNIAYRFEGINSSRDISPKTILDLLKNARSDIALSNDSFGRKSLSEVLRIIESGAYELPKQSGQEPVRIIDLSEAKKHIEFYRRNSEGGCKSCLNLGIECVDNQDTDFSFYCRISDPEYNRLQATLRGNGCSFIGYSSKVSTHYNSPCSDCKPRFCPPLAQLVSECRELRFLDSAQVKDSAVAP